MRRLGEEGLIRNAGTRTRVIVGAAPGSTAPQLLKGAVVLLAGEHFPAAEHGADRAPGWNYQVIYGAIEAIRENGRHTLKINGTVLTDREVHECSASGVAGVVAPRYRSVRERHEVMVRELRAKDIRFVVDADAPEDQSCYRVVPDHEVGAYQLTRYLLEQGRRRILHMGLARQQWWFEARLEGYTRAMRDAGLEPMPPAVVAPSPYSLAAEGTAHRFEVVVRHNLAYLAEHLTSVDRPDAIMCLSDESVSFISAACRLCHLEPGRDILIAGYDNFWQESWGRRYEPTPPVATIDKNNGEIGRQMVQMLITPEPAEKCIRVAPTLITTDVPDVTSR